MQTQPLDQRHGLVSGHARETKPALGKNMSKLCRMISARATLCYIIILGLLFPCLSSPLLFYVNSLITAWWGSGGIGRVDKTGVLNIVPGERLGRGEGLKSTNINVYNISTVPQMSVLVPKNPFLPNSN